MFDWMTWSIWALGCVIMVAWIIVPIREFKSMLRHRNAKKDDRSDVEIP